MHILLKPVNQNLLASALSHSQTLRPYQRGCCIQSQHLVLQTYSLERLREKQMRAGNRNHCAKEKREQRLEAVTYLWSTFPAPWLEVGEAAELSATAFIYGFLLPAVRTSLLADGHEPEVCKYSFSGWRPAAVTTTADSVMHECGSNYGEWAWGSFQHEHAGCDVLWIRLVSYILQLWQLHFLHLHYWSIVTVLYFQLSEETLIKCIIILNTNSPGEKLRQPH